MVAMAPASAAPRRMGSDRRWFALLFVTFAYFYQGGFANSNARFDLALSIALSHHYYIDELSGNTIDKAWARGHTWSEKAPGSAYAALPIPILASRVVGPAAVRTDPRLAAVLLHLATALSVGLVSAVAAVAFRRLLGVLNPAQTPARAWALTAAVFLGTPLFVYSTTLFGHALAAGWLIIGLYLGMRAAMDERRATRCAIASAFVLGLAVLTEYPAVLPALAVAAAVLLGARRKRDVLAGAVGAIPPIVLLMVHQYVSFGSPFAIGYGHLQGTPFGTGMSRGMFGIAAPSAGAAAQLLFGTYRGLFVYGPVLIVAVAGFVFWPRRLGRRVALPLLAGSAALWLVIASYTYWQGGPAFGPRHLLPIVPLLGCGLAFWPSGKAWNGALAAVATMSVAINLVGTATTPFVSEFLPDPIVSVYPRLAIEGAMSINPVGFLTPTAEVDSRWQNPARFPNAAYNLGECLGLRGWLSLAPLALVWVVGLGWRRAPEVRPRES